MKVHHRVLLFSLILLVGSSCAPRVSDSIELTSIPRIGMSQDKPSAVQEMYLYVDQFKDVRVEQKVAQFGERSIYAKNQINSIVKDGIERAFQEKGFRISDSAATVLAGEIRNWVAEIESGFPATVRSKASIYVELLDPANRRIYSGNYQGTAMVEHTSVNEQDVNTALTIAMQQAIKQVVSDQRLQKLLSSY